MNRRCPIVLLATVCLVCCVQGIPGPTDPPANAFAEKELVQVDQFGGGIRAVAARGEQAFVGVGPRLFVLDVTDRAKPFALGRGPVLGGVVQDIALEGDVAWVATGDAGLYALDVSEPTGPRVIAHHPLPGAWAENVLMHEGAAIIFSDSGNFRSVWIVAIDDQQPLESRELEPIRLSSPTRGVAVFGDTIYVGAGNTANRDAPLIAAYDIADPTAPRLLHVTVLPADPLHLVSIEDRLIAITRREGLGTHLVVYERDVSGQLDEVERLAIGPEFPGMLAAHERRLFVNADAKIHVYELAEDWSPRRSGTMPSDSRLEVGGFGRMAVEEEHLYIATGDQPGLLVVAVGDTDSMSIRGGYAGPMMVDTVGLSGNRVLMSALADPRIWSVPRQGQAELGAPSILAGVESGGFDGRPEDGLIIATLGERLVAIDASDFGRPITVSVAPLASHGRNVRVFDDVAIVARLARRVDVIYTVVELFRVIEGNELRHVSALEQGASAFGGAPWRAPMLFVLDGAFLRVLDLADPHEVRPVSEMEHGLEPGPALAAVSDAKLYLATDTDLVMVDIATPAAPRIVSRYALPHGEDTLIDMAVVDGHLAILMEHELHLLALSENGRPTRTSTVPMLWGAMDMDVDEDRIYVADTLAGVSVWRIEDTQAATPTALPNAGTPVVLLPWLAR